MSASEADTILVERGAVTRLRLNRPEQLNAMTAEMGLRLAELVDELNGDPSVRVVVLEGAGKAFSAGGDFGLIEGNTRRSPAENQRDMVTFYGRFLRVLDLRMPTVAVLRGAAVGAGLCVALACDLRLATDTAKLGANFTRVGLHPGMGASLLLANVVGPANARDLLLTGRLVRGAEAAELGLVHAAVPEASLTALVEERILDLLAAAPIAQAQTKETLNLPLRAALTTALAREAACQAVGFATADVAEAVAAFRERRTPVFRGA